MLTGGAVAPVACSVRIPAGQSRRAATCVVSESAVYCVYLQLCMHFDRLHTLQHRQGRDHQRRRRRPSPQQSHSGSTSSSSGASGHSKLAMDTASHGFSSTPAACVVIIKTMLRVNFSFVVYTQTQAHDKDTNRQNIRRERERVTRPIAHWKASRFSGVKVSQVKGISRDMTTTLGWQHVHFFLGTTSGSST